MAESSTLKTRLAEFHQQGRVLLQEQTRALDATIDQLNERDPNHLSPSVWIPMLMLQAVGVSVQSVLALTQERTMAIRDGFGIARSTVETAINAAFISVQGDAMGERAIRHMRRSDGGTLIAQRRLVICTSLPRAISK
ncbi:hypothetical protein D2V17_11840 [Aurantiacibacter xanthus]|uniref:Uncharacterized protein n=1 Tax=Aurantiacibacter xanthus TaxID=1784712 RepID=A0A3A1P6V3_9SPHN|nr:hypothetical protein [Aurantiacibacter xanthus]RIV84381.1 hypothetical protein D2V17_11840 [Aurantiacibacter xanthus]